jgi:hypothetical protein
VEELRELERVVEGVQECNRIKLFGFQRKFPMDGAIGSPPAGLIILGKWRKTVGVSDVEWRATCVSVR